MKPEILQVGDFPEVQMDRAQRYQVQRCLRRSLELEERECETMSFRAINAIPCAVETISLPHPYDGPHERGSRRYT